ncbi:MAG: Rieske 2Fe-2S domain-containing protein [Chloroflexota bacterium]|nr:Rieske 2Fe-2S domain-containing protein [Chloroflexota bacterium]
MGRWVEVGSTAEIADGSMREIAVEGVELLLARAGDSYFAIASRCPPHGRAPVQRHAERDHRHVPTTRLAV